MDWKIWVLLANATDKDGGSLWLEDACHILDAQDVGADLDDLVNEIHVVLKVVLLLGVQH